MDFLDCFDFNKRTSLYIHVPFCKSKCSYCAFYSKTCNDSEIDVYYSKLITELEVLVSRMNGKPFYTAFIGGGNPGCLSVKQLGAICSLVCLNGRPDEFTIEMNPESLTLDHFLLFDKCLTRLSMGVQSLDAKALSFLGRNATLNQTNGGMHLALELRKRHGTQINFDLITCLPSWHDYMSDVKRVVKDFSPDHLSVYSLTLEENTPLGRQNPILPDSDDQSLILQEIWAFLESSGYHQYEVSNFALDGKYSRHNSVYWDYEQYVGLGPAADSTAFGRNGVFRIESSCKIGGNPFEEYKIYQLSQKETLEEFVLMGLRHSKGLNLKRLLSDFGVTLKEIPSGYNEKDGYLVPSKEGLLIADWAASRVLESIDS